MEFNFEKLRAWQSAREWVKEVYLLTQAFPPDERFGLTNQLRRAAVSVASNLAEGIGRQSGKDRAHFSNLAYSSLMEALNQCILASDLGYISDERLRNLRQSSDKLARLIAGLRNAQLHSKKT
ncbi:MAG: four helix bundle protein [Lewinellaceae bacterium]|nr:four helix bundle protein [Lewinellaceae bacterium]